MVWLVDNGSTVDRSDECRQLSPDLRILKLGENFGWAGGYNRALKIALAEGYEFAYLLNNDTIPEKGFLAAVLEVISQDKKLAATGSMIVYSDKEWIKFDGKYYGLRECRYKTDRKLEWRLVPEVNGAGMLVRLAAMEANGWFDERFFCYWEEVDWCLRMRVHGWRIAIAPASVVFHAGEGSNTSANAAYYRYRNQFLLRTRYKDRIDSKSKFRLIRSGLATASNYLIKNDRAGYETMLAALRDGLSGRFGKRQVLPLGLAWLVAGTIYARLSWLYRKLKP